MASEPLTLAVAGPLIVSHCDAARVAALQDVGVAYVLETYAAPFTDTGRLFSLLSEFLPPFGGWKLCHRKHVRLSAAARAVVDLIAGPQSR